MTRRELLAGAASAALLRAKTHIDKTQISAITDEIGLTTDDAIAFAHKYGMQWVELRNEPALKREYFTLEPAQIKADAVRFTREGLRVSFINTSLLKFSWPGTEPKRSRPETPEARTRRLANEQARWDRRADDLQKAIQCAHMMGCDKVRVFTGNRLEDPASLQPRIADVIGEMAVAAEKEKVYLLIENEGSQNIATAKELQEVLKLIPSKFVGCNWDPHNAYGKEQAFPDGYSALPWKRVLNIQVKAKGVLPDSPEKEDWTAIFQALYKDGYAYRVGLETHIFDGTLIQKANASMDEIMHIVGRL
jgi:sugar phosphate isomerase/epimerase